MLDAMKGLGLERTARYPIRGIFLACCASTVTATASNAPANRIDPSAVFLNGRFISGVIYHADGGKENCYLRAPLFSGCLGNCLSLVSDENTSGIPAGTGGMKAKGLH